MFFVTVRKKEKKAAKMEFKIMTITKSLFIFADDKEETKLQIIILIFFNNHRIQISALSLDGCTFVLPVTPYSRSPPSTVLKPADSCTLGCGGSANVRL